MADQVKSAIDNQKKKKPVTEPRRPSRERINQERRQEVLNVAARLFADKGFHGTSMDDIARELGILKGSLYYWIDSKDALLTEILEGSVLETIVEAEEIVEREASAADRLRALIHGHILSWVRNPNNFWVYVSEWRWLNPPSQQRFRDERDRLEAIYKRTIREGIAAGEFAVSEEDVTVIVNLIFGAMNWFPRWYRPGGRASHEDIADVLATLVLDGLRHAKLEQALQFPDSA